MQTKQDINDCQVELHSDTRHVLYRNYYNNHLATFNQVKSQRHTCI